MTPEYYTMDELRTLGCPNELLMQYVLMPKTWIDDMLRKSGECPDCEPKRNYECGPCFQYRTGGET